jgi:type II secretory pathway predicted ATPase ExeA
MPRNGHVRCGGRARETGRAESRHRALVRSHIARLHRVSSGLPRALNNAATAALIAAAAAGQDLVDDACAKKAVTELTRD